MLVVSARRSSSLLRKADRTLGRTSTQFRQVLLRAQRRVPVSKLTQAFEARDLTTLERLAMQSVLYLQIALRDVMEQELFALYRLGANVARDEFPEQLATLRRGDIPRMPAHIRMRFDPKNPKAAAWAQLYGAKRVREITEATREAIQETIADALMHGEHARSSARLLRDVVTLDSRRAEAVRNAHARLFDAEVGDSVDIGGRAVRVPRDLDGIAKVLDRYAEQLTAQRAETIARTETLEAINKGQRDTWVEAQAEGLIPAGVMREWIATAGACPDCEALEGSTAFVDGLFDGGVDGPPLHPNCRCTTGLSYA